MIASQVSVGQYGYIYCDIPRYMYYRAGDEIRARLWVGNVTDIERTFMIRTRLIKSNRILSEGVIKVNDTSWFTLEPYESAEVTGSIVAESSDAILLMELIDRSGDIVASSFTNLITPAQIQYTGPQPIQPAPDITSQIFQLLLLVSIMSMTSTMIRG